GRPVDEPAGLGLDRDVGEPELGGAAEFGLDAPDGLASQLLVDVGDDDRRLLLAESPGHRSSDVPGRTGDHDDVVVEPAHPVPSPLAATSAVDTAGRRLAIACPRLRLLSTVYKIGGVR